jgi:hypothetical protein
MDRTLVRSGAVLLVALAVPAALALPAAACTPEGGELPGINCLPPAGLALPGAWLFAIALGAWLGSRRPPVALSTSVAACLGIAAGTYIGLRLLAASRVDWLHGAVNPLTLALPLVALGVAGLAAVIVRRR